MPFYSAPSCLRIVTYQSRFPRYFPIYRTAQIWYDLSEKQKEAAAGFKLIEKRLQDASGETTPQEESPVKSTAVKSKMFGNVSSNYY